MILLFVQVEQWFDDYLEQVEEYFVWKGIECMVYLWNEVREECIDVFDMNFEFIKNCD